MDKKPNYREPYIRNKKDLQQEFISLQDYSNVTELAQVLPHLLDVNKHTYSQQDEAFAYILRSNNDDDIHKSIKYGIWTSSKENNEKLNFKFKEAEQKGVSVYLFYSVVKSGQFVGVAKLLSEYQQESFQYWWEMKKWKGHFKVQWILVKDVTNKYFEHLKNGENIEVTRSKDGVSVDWQTSGREMMKIFEQASQSKSILNDFVQFDQREQMLRNYKCQQQQYDFQNYYYGYGYNQYGQWKQYQN